MIGGLCDFWKWQVPHTEGYCVIFPCWMAHHIAMTQCVDINHTNQGLCFGLISMDCFDMFWPYIMGGMIHSLFSSRNELHWPLVGSRLSNHHFKRCFIQTNTIWGALYQNSHFNGVHDGQPWHLWVFPSFFDKNKSLSNKLIKHVSHSPWYYPKKISNISQNFPVPLSFPIAMAILGSRWVARIALQAASWSPKNWWFSVSGSDDSPLKKWVQFFVHDQNHG